MKNLILGLVGSLIIVYTSAVILGIYHMNVRKNELENTVSAVLENVMTEYYSSYSMGGAEMIPSNREISEKLAGRITERVKNQDGLNITVPVCNIKKGIISVYVTEQFVLPGGVNKEMNVRKTIIVDREAGD